MRRLSAAELVVLLLGICSCFIYSGEATRPGPGTFSGRGDVGALYISEMMVRPSLLLQRKILEEGTRQAETPTWTESKPDEKEKKWEPKTEEKNDSPKNEKKQWESQPKAAEENQKDWKPKQDTEKKWDSQPNKVEQKTPEWKPKEDAAEKKWDSQPKAEEEKKSEWKPKEDVEKKWESQPKAEEEKKEWIQEQPKTDEVAVNPQESKPADKDPIKVEEKKEETWQKQEPNKSETQEQQIKVEEKKEETSQNQEPKKSETQQQQIKVEENKEEETWKNQEPTKSETQEQQIKVEEKEETWQNQETRKSETQEQQIKVEEKKDEQQSWKPAEEWKPETTKEETAKVEKVEEPKAADENKSETQSQSTNTWADQPKEVNTKVEEKKDDSPPKVENQQKEEPKKEVDNKETIQPKVEENKEDKLQEEEKKQQEQQRQQAQEAQEQKNVDRMTAYGRDMQSDLAEDYPDFLDELRNFPERFRKTAENVKDHIKYSGLEKYSTQSKELFNQANQQIQESFTPLLGKDYAPFIAYLVSYGLLLLPLVLVTYLLDRIRARYSLQKILLFMNIYLSAYFAALLVVALLLNTEPMNFFMKYATSSYIFLQLLQAFGYLMYLLLNAVDLISTCSNGRIAPKFSSVLQLVVVVAVGFHYYVTVFHRAMERKAPLTSWKIYGFYSLSFIFLCLFARIERGKKQYTPIEVDDTTDKKN
ncbi:unnamed protein product [Calypogeia fissa]